jgi:integrase
MPRGKLLALRWSDIDFDRGTLAIHWILTWGPDSLGFLASRNLPPLQGPADAVRGCAASPSSTKWSGLRRYWATT